MTDPRTVGIIKGQTANQAFSLAIKDSHINSLWDNGQMDKILSDYTKIYDRLLVVNNKLLLNGEDKETIPEKEIKAEESSDAPVCSGCKTVKMTKKVVEYSKLKFDKVLCFDCQKEAKK